MTHARTRWWGGALSVSVAVSVLHATASSPVRPRYVTFDEARPFIQAAGAVAGGVTALPGEKQGAAWSSWLQAHDAQIRERVQRGEQDSLAYLLLFGTSFTKAPRLTKDLAEELARTPTPQGRAAPTLDEAVAQAMDTRLDDLIRGMQSPGRNERLAWARTTLDRLGHRLDSPQGRLAARVFLLENYARVSRESADLGTALAQAWQAAEREAGLATRARLFADRGLAPDTSWPIGFAVAESLRTLAASVGRGPSSVRRVAVIGPGLDFIDKDEGYDYYPPQTLQPLAIIDALVTLRLADADGLRVTAIDLSPRVNAHLRSLSTRPSTQPYDLQLVRDRRVAWTPEASRYWSDFGSAIGRSVTPTVPPSTADWLERRAVRTRPDLLARIAALDLNIVCQRADLPAGERFDLVVATNILLYYDVFDQALAAANIAHVLAPGGLLVTNTRLDDLPGLPLRRVQQTTSVFSDRPGDGEHVFAYQRP